MLTTIAEDLPQATPDGFVERFSWGAFLLAWPWYLAHRLWLRALLFMTPHILLGVLLLMGQRASGLLLLLLSVACNVLAALLALSARSTAAPKMSPTALGRFETTERIWLVPGIVINVVGWANVIARLMR